jgi:hypothetical protein
MHGLDLAFSRSFRSEPARRPLASGLLELHALLHPQNRNDWFAVVVRFILNCHDDHVIGTARCFLCRALGSNGPFLGFGYSAFSHFPNQLAKIHLVSCVVPVELLNMGNEWFNRREFFLLASARMDLEDSEPLRANK